MSVDPILAAHKQWLGYLQPVGLVVSPHALAAGQAVVQHNVAALQQTLQALVRVPGDDGDTWGPVRDVPRLLCEVLGWRPSDLAGGPGGPPLPDALAVPLPEYGETLRPTFAVPDGDGWLMLLQVMPEGTGLDEPAPEDSTGWDAAPQAKFERLLRELHVPIGLLLNGQAVRLVYAPRGETSGHLSFPVAAMCEVAGRPILGAFELLLGADRLFVEADDRRLPALLAASRRYQNEVSTRLAEQVTEALLDLLRGFQAADESARGRLLGELARTDPQHVYGGLLTVLLRLVFLLYAEDRGLMPGDAVYTGHYAVTGLYQRLREDAGKYPDTMDQRYGAWAWLLSLFRLVYTGGTHERLHLPARHGSLFHPGDAGQGYPFLEGRPRAGSWQPGERLEPPRVSDGVVWRVLHKLLVLGGERLSYRSLDVEQIGSVYESMMGYTLERAAGPSIAVRPGHVVVDLAALLSQKPADRAKFLKDHAGCDLSGQALAALKDAKYPEAAAAALGRKTSPRTPQILPPGSLYLQPGEERRKSGSHYTPRTLTGPIVETTLRPVLEALGERPTPAQILSLKICDPAMGSGAFLVETCRQLGAHLVRAWELNNATPPIPPDEEPLLHARRLVAQRCLYGVDKNPFAVDLAKLSLWLVTLAKDHPFTFLDHALKHGDSLVGLSKAQIAEFRWDDRVRFEGPLFSHTLHKVQTAQSLRQDLQNLGEDDDAQKRERLSSADREIDDLRLRGDAIIYSFFKGGEKDKEREKKREALHPTAEQAQKGDPKATATLRQLSEEMREDARPVVPFHWEIEFPEVFGRENPGFDCFVGNPPFLGGKRISSNFGSAYKDWLVCVFAGTTGNADLSAFFFRRVYSIVRPGGTLGLIATNTIAQGDTLTSGLAAIRDLGGTIFAATKRASWPGVAAVKISIVHIRRGDYSGPKSLDGRPVERISAFLFHAGGDHFPAQLEENAGRSFIGCDLKGAGFTFEDGVAGATSVQEMERLCERRPVNSERIRPYIGGEEINSDPRQSHHRFVIDFEEMTLEQASAWPELLSIVETKVKPERLKKSSELAEWPWWQFWRVRARLREAIRQLPQILVNCQVSANVAFSFQPQGRIFAHTVNVYALPSFGSFAALQSRVHEVWARFFGSSMKDDLRYTPSDCFETFPFPPGWQTNSALEQAGKQYYDFRADLMVRNDEGLTSTYNRFHDPDERSPDIFKLRELHAAMDRAVLAAYSWTDLAERASCEFRLDYEDDDDTETDEAPRARTKKKPWRYKWPQDFHDEVLARLLDLNQKRAEQERLAGAATEAAAKSSPAKKTAKKAAVKRTSKQSTSQASLLSDDD